MVPIQTLINAFGRNVEIIQLQTENLSHEDSLIQLPFRSNCLNWVVGHVLTNRCNILRLLKAKDLIPDVELDHYERESEPILEDGRGVLPLEDLLSLLEKIQVDLSTVLQKMTPEALQRPTVYRNRPERPLAGWLFFLYFHDCYHVGQTELLRQAAGKDDKVI